MTGAAMGSFEFEAEIWEHDGPNPWFFVSLPEPLSDEIDERFGHRAAGFGSIRVEVTIGRSTWRTSIFPDTKRATYVLPLKQAVRRAEGVTTGSSVRVSLDIVDA